MPETAIGCSSKTSSMHPYRRQRNALSCDYYCLSCRKSFVPTNYKSHCDWYNCKNLHILILSNWFKKNSSWLDLIPGIVHLFKKILKHVQFHSQTSIQMYIWCLQEVGSIIGKKGEIVKRFREEVSYEYQNFCINLVSKWVNQSQLNYNFITYRLY